MTNPRGVDAIRQIKPGNVVMTQRGSLMSSREPNKELLIGLAMLRQNWDRKQQTFLDNFTPFLADCLNHQGRNGIADAELSACVQERFGIHIPVTVQGTILKRMRREELATRSDGLNYPTIATQDLEPLDAARDESGRKINALVNRLSKYAQSEHDLAWGEDEAEEALQYFIEDWTSSISLMRARVDGQPYETKLVQDRETDYIVSSFVLHLRSVDPEPFEWLIDVVKGSMLSVGLYLDPGRMDQSFEGLTAYLDTPFLLGLIAGEDDTCTAAAEVLELASELKMNAACFEHTVGEMQSVLDRQARAIRRVGGESQTDPGPRSLSDRFSASDLEEMSGNLPTVLAEHGVKVKREPVWDGTATTDEQSLQDELQAAVQYRSERTREKDVRSLLAVHRIRRGGSPVRLEDARALFVTTNDELVKGSGKHFGTDREAHAVPIALTDHELATLLWLKSPTPRPDLPWKQVVADCRAALNPNDALWNQYLQELATLEARAKVDPEMYYIARFSNEARRELMGRTHGDPRKVDSRTVAEILAATRDEMTAPHRQQLSAVEQESARAQAALSNERAGREAAEQEKVALRGKVEKIQEVNKEKDGQLDALAEDLANTKRALRKAAAGVAGVVMALATAAAVLWLPLVVASDQRWLIGAGGMIMSISAAFAIQKPKHPQIWFGVFVPAVVMTLPPLLSS